LAAGGQNDLRGHGGPHKALYAYSFANLLDRKTGGPGENPTLSAISEGGVRLADRFRVGTADESPSKSG
jgi:MOSC domain-containing protein YiiM